MNRSTLARRYAPLVAVVLIQLLIIGFVPSKAAKPASQQVAAGSTGARGAGGAASGSGGPGGTGVTVPGAASGAVNGTTNTVPGLPPGVDAAGDTTHCVNGREFDPAIVYWAPPCVPGTIGATGVNNGSATYPGVTGDEVTLVDYVSDFGAEVNAIQQAQGGLVTFSDAQTLDKAWETFINEHYVLYGRHVKIVTYQGTCQSVPPNYSCLIPEMDSIVNTYHPYAVEWQVSLCSKCYAELARLGVVAFGGVGFSKDLADALKPYFYASGESSTNMAQHFAEFYCGQLAQTKVAYAGHQNTLQDLNGRDRVLGVISTDDPDNKDMVKNFLYPLLHDTCGVTVTHEYFYSKDPNTSSQQIAAGIAAMDTQPNPATTVLCLCETIAPAFLFSGEQTNNYYPENVIATDQQMDYDVIAQSYGPDPGNGGPTLGCPSPQVGCEFDLAFGIGEIGVEEPQDNDPGIRLFKAGGGTQLPGSVSAQSATFTAREWIMLANLIEAAGPNLTPDTMAAQAASLGSVGGPGTPNELLQFPNGSGHWGQDAKLIYFSRHQTSPYNGLAGGYIQVGDRITLGHWPSRPNGPDIPVTR